MYATFNFGCQYMYTYLQLSHVQPAYLLLFSLLQAQQGERLLFAMNESENATNSTASPTIYNYGVSPVMVSYSIFYAIIIIASLLGNITVCVVILNTRSLRQSINSCFILSLAVSDLITACLVMPFDLELIISFQRWIHGEIMCNVWTTTYLMAVPTSILSLLALTVYRYRLLQEPLDIYKASPLMTRRRASIVVCCLWAYSMLFSLAPVFGWKRLPRSVNYEYCYFNLSLTYSVLSSMINFVIPVIIASFLNCRMFCVAIKRAHPPKTGRRAGKTKHMTRLKEKRGNVSVAKPESIEDPARLGTVQESSNSPTSEQQPVESMRSRHEAILIRKLQQRNIRAARTTFLIVFSFVVCWLPHSFLSITYILCRKCAIDIAKHPELLTFFLMLGYLNSAINPVLYSFRSSEFKKAVKDFIRRRRPFRGVQIRPENTRAVERRAPTLQTIPSVDDFGVNLTSNSRLDCKMLQRFVKHSCNSRVTNL